MNLIKSSNQTQNKRKYKDRVEIVNYIDTKHEIQAKNFLFTK